MNRGVFLGLIALGGAGVTTAQTPAKPNAAKPKAAAVPKAVPPKVVPLAAQWPPIEVRKLANGTEVAIMHEPAHSVVSIGAVLDVGTEIDPAGKTGLGELTRALLGAGTTTRTGAQIQAQATDLGAIIVPTAVHAQAEDLDSALAIMADQLLHPAFPDAAVTRLKARVKAGLETDNENGRVQASRVFKHVMYGAGHPYARRQTPEDVAAITRDDVVAFYAKYLRPPNIRFVVAGAITADSAVAKLDRYFGKWEAGTVAQTPAPASVALKPTTIYLLDRPKAPLSAVWVGGGGPRRDAPDYAAISVMNTILGGGPTSRLNTVLHQQKKFTNGAQSEFIFRRSPEPGTFVALAAVTPSVTDSAVVTLLQELRAIRGERPITDAEFRAAHDRLTAQLSQELASVPQRAAALMDASISHLPLDYYETLRVKLAALTREDVQAAAQANIDPEHLAIVVVGDRATIEPALRAAKVAPVVIVDGKGSPITP